MSTEDEKSDMNNGSNDRKSMMMYVSAMLIFGTIGVFRRYSPLSSELLAFTRGMLGSLFLIVFIRLKRGKVRFHLTRQQLFWLILSGGIVYTVGMIPFARKSRGAHFIWHFFALAGALLQWLGIWLVVF